MTTPNLANAKPRPHRERQPRLRIHWPLRIHSANLDVKGMARDLSSSGIRAFVDSNTAELLRGHETVTLTLSPDNAPAIDFEATLSRTRLTDKGADIGFRFSSLSAEAAQAIERILDDPRAVVLLAGFRDRDPLLERMLVSTNADVLYENDEAAVTRQLRDREIAVLVVGPMYSAEPGQALLAACIEACEDKLTVNIVTTAGQNLELFQHFVNLDRLFYITAAAPQRGELIAIIRGAVERYWALSFRSQSDTALTDNDNLKLFESIIQHAHGISQQTNLRDIGQHVTSSIKEFTDADRGYYLVYDAEGQVLWAFESDRDGHREVSAATGLVSFVAKTGRGLSINQVASDSRYDKDTDDPAGNGSEFLVAEPVVSVDNRVIAVLVSIRSTRRGPFSATNRAALRLLCSQLASSFSRVVLTAPNRRAGGSPSRRQ